MSTKKKTALQQYVEVMRLNKGEIYKTFIAQEREQIEEAYSWGETDGYDEAQGDGRTYEDKKQYFTNTYESTNASNT